MMHSMKRKIGAKTEENAEFNDYKGRLENLKGALSAAHLALKKSDETWKALVTAQKTFAENFSNKYPDNDTTRKYSRKSAESSQAVAKDFILKVDAESGTHWKLDAQVQAYLEEIAEVESTYKELARANTDLELYKKKVQDLQKPKRNANKEVSDKEKAKVERNVKKLEQTQEKHDKLLEQTVMRMQEIYAKRQVALKFAYVAYWISQIRAFEMLDKSLVTTRGFVTTSVDALLELKISKITEDDVNNIVNVCTPEASPVAKSSEPPSSPIEKDEAETQLAAA